MARIPVRIRGQLEEKGEQEKRTKLQMAMWNIIRGAVSVLHAGAPL